jgi:hypothetical protein
MTDIADQLKSFSPLSEEILCITVFLEAVTNQSELSTKPLSFLINSDFLITCEECNS